MRIVHETPIMNLIESRRNRGDGRDGLLGRIIGIIAPIRGQLLPVVLEGPMHWSGFTGLYRELVLCHHNPDRGSWNVHHV